MYSIWNCQLINDKTIILVSNSMQFGVRVDENGDRCDRSDDILEIRLYGVCIQASYQ